MPASETQHYSPRNRAGEALNSAEFQNNPCKRHTLLALPAALTWS